MAMTQTFQLDVTRGFPVTPGAPYPLGATVDDTGVNFSVFSQHAWSVELLLFDAHDPGMLIQAVQLDPRIHKSFCIWHVHLDGLPAGTRYAYRVDGPDDAWQGHRFDRAKALVDPFAREVDDRLFSQLAACLPGDNIRSSLRGVVVDDRDYDWEGDRPLRRPLNESIIYEMHVGGFTMSPTSGVGLPGTFAGLIEKIPYLQDLGITAVELLPTFAFDHREPLPGRASEGHPLYNYWGYDPYAHFAPHPGYCASTGRGHHVHQFRDAVKALHRAGIQVILDVVFNHTAEGNERGPALSFRGFDNQIYYLRDGGSGDQWRYANYSGCGNTLNANHAIVTHLIQECLTYWVRENHVDGFRFDEASVLSRGENGSPLDFPPTVWAIELSPALADTKVIAEAWDAGGLYQVGQFPGRWGQWNGRYRDDIRAFVRGDPGIVGRVASRICGSADIFEQVGEAPFNSVNFVTAHDGFTLNDLVSYNSKHNELNGEQGRDGMDDNRSWNCGVEGATDDPAVERLRRRQIKNFAAILLVSQGVPMLVAGDEIRRTQRGNNNAYCQNNDLSWMNWDMTETHAEIHRFFRLMIAFRKQHTSLERTRFASGLQSHHGLPDISWHGCRLGSPGWDDPNARALAFTLAGLTPQESDLHVLLNMHSEPLVFEVPEIPSRRWRRAVDTAADTPWDISPHGAGMPLAGPTRVREHSVVILVASPEPVPGRPRRNSHRVRSGSHEWTP